ncbi:MAG: hypothetical protein HY541_08655 [Deltaproteobacteria bacterium]|nr:hypothetical protein [Deltaproteobacteria bacterium]
MERIGNVAKNTSPLFSFKISKPQTPWDACQKKKSGSTRNSSGSFHKSFSGGGTYRGDIGRLNGCTVIEVKGEFNSIGSSNVIVESGRASVKQGSVWVSFYKDDKQTKTFLVSPDTPVELSGEIGFEWVPGGDSYYPVVIEAVEGTAEGIHLEIEFR